MKVVHLIWSLDCGGSETLLVDIANEQSHRADVVVVIGNNRLDPTILSRFCRGVTLKRLGRPQGSRNPWYILKLYALLQRMAPDIVHAHQESFIKVLRLMPTPRVHTVHNTGIELTSARKRFHAIYAISEAVQNDLERRYPDMQTVLIPNGIVCSNIATKASYGGRPFRIVQISRLDHAQKGQDILLRALARVIEEKGPGAVTIDFIGTGASREYLLEVARESGVSEACHFIGQKTREEIYQDLKTYDLLVQPSRFEGFGLTVVEAMAARVPVLVSDVEGPMEIINGGQYGYHFRSEDTGDCAMRILEVIDASCTDGFSGVQERNAEYVRAHFDVSGTAGRYLAEYEKLCRY